MRELSLFTGTGGGILGSKLLGWTTVGYVEKEPYCQKVIRQRIIDGIFDRAPIFGDIRTFISDGYTRRYRNLVDIITGGFPCQPFSVAGDRLAENDPRNMWPETAECLRIIRPGKALFENVTGLLSSGYFDTILSDLHTLGYNVRWGVLSAGELGAPHKRDRLWIFCSDSNNKSRPTKQEREHKGSKESDGCSLREVAAPNSNPAIINDWKNSPKQMQRQVQQSGECDIKTDVSNTNKLNDDNTGLGTSKISQQQAPTIFNIPNSTIKGLEREVSESWTGEHDGLFTECGWWSTEPGVGRVVDGMANRAHRLKAIGNGQVPITMAAAFQALSQGII